MRLIKQIFSHPKKPSNKLLKLGFTDKHGNNYYFCSAKDMPEHRIIAAQTALKLANMSLCDEYLTVFIKLIKESLKRNEIGNIHALISDIEARKTLASEKNSMIDLAVCFFWINDQPFATKSEEHEAILRRNINNDVELMSFFFQNLSGQLNNSKGLIDYLEYYQTLEYKMIMQRSKDLLQMLSENLI